MSTGDKPDNLPTDLEDVERLEYLDHDRCLLDSYIMVPIRAEVIIGLFHLQRGECYLFIYSCYGLAMCFGIPGWK